MDTVRIRKMPALILVVFMLLSSALTCGAAEADKGQMKGEGAIHERIAGMSDEDVRKLLVDTLQEKASATKEVAGGIPGDNALGTMLGVLGRESETARKELRNLAEKIPGSVSNLLETFRSIGPSGTLGGAVRTVLPVLLFIGIGFIAEKAINRLLRKKYFGYFKGNADTSTQPDAGISSTQKLAGVLTTVLPSILGFVVFFVTAYFSYFAFVWTGSPALTLIFLAVLLTISLIRIVAIIAEAVLSPAVRRFRLLPLDDHAARLCYRLIVLTWSYIVSALMLIIVMQRLGARPETIVLLKIFAATLLLVATAVAVVVKKKEVAAAILAPSPDGTEVSSGKQNLAAIWHYLALLYLAILWGLMIMSVTGSATQTKGAFLVSFFVLPIWLAADQVVQWLVKHIMLSLRLHEEPSAPQPPGTVSVDEPQRGNDLFTKVNRYARLAVFVAIVLWIARLWGYTIPFISQLSGVLFDSLIIMALALIFWQFINSRLEKKIKESLPEGTKRPDDVDDEWGDAAAQGRSYTLLPIIRSFVASVLVVMVVLTILSSLGVNIGPLLAGAGVVGLAVGFGAQKLVSDIFSGVFYLLDDAFRVGEYLTAGGIMGTVEKISLRNVMLRHHRGMLQIVPYSQLGTITNFMRGGIIEKFSLDFAYDADIDKIRKIIKKVGQEMLEDPELGKNFIRPLRSQGVREIANSVMTIRVKFTAKPGTQFTIRREAFKRITAAMQAKGIQYAHRKVIVDLPSPAANQEDPARTQKLAQAAGAAARQIFDEEEKLKQQLAQEKSGA